MATKLKKLKVNEISLVDTPANPHAEAVLYKRDEQGAFKEFLTKMFEKFPVFVEDESGNEVELQLTTKGKTMSKTKEVSLEDMNKRLEAIETEKEVLKSIAALTGLEKTHYDSLDADAQEAFLKMSAEEKKKLVDEKEAEAEKKSLKKSDDVRKQDLERIEKLEEQVRNNTYEKRATTELVNLAGSVEERAELLKALDSVEDKAQREALTKALDKANEVNGSFMKELGSDDDRTSDAETKLNKMAEQHAKDNKVSFEKGYSSVLETPEGEKLYAEIGKQ